MTVRIQCAEGLTRRSFVKATAAWSLAGLPRLALAGAAPRQGRLLVVLMRGGMDGLFVVPPTGDSLLRDHRKDLVEQNLLELDTWTSSGRSL